MGLAGRSVLLQYVPSMLTRRPRSSRAFSRSGASRGLLSVLTLGVPIWIFSQGLVSCGSDDEDRACVPGELKACAVAGETCEAVQTCNADGTAYGACACPGDGSNGSAGSAGSSNTGGSSNAGGGAAGAGAGPVDPLFPAAARAIGAPCNVDADCPTGPGGETPLICITPTSTAEFTTGSPQGGYCTAVCEDSVEDCESLDGLSACGLIDEATNSGFCIALCLPGSNNVKCGADRAQACFAFPGQEEVGACFPVCQSDAACGNGLFCDLGATGLGLCTATAPVGGDVGAACTPETAATDCKSGVCVTLLDPDSGAEAGNFCSANCTFGLIEGCGFDDPSSVAREAVCVRPQLNGGGGGDLGFCFELCDADADCAQEGWVCAQELTEEAVAIVGRQGQCVPPTLSDGGVVVDAGAN